MGQATEIGPDLASLAVFARAPRFCVTNRAATIRAATDPGVMAAGGLYFYFVIYVAIENASDSLQQTLRRVYTYV